MTSNIFYVYILFRPRTGIPFYVGKGCRDRWLTHGKSNHNTWKNNIIKKARREGLIIPRVKIAENLSEDNAFEIEAVFIKAIGRHPNGPLVNKVDGGGGLAGKIFTKKERALISAKTAEAMARPEVKEKQSVGIKRAFKNPAIRAKISENTTKQMSDPAARAIISAAQKGRKRTAEQKIAISAASMGRRHTEEAKAAISAKLKGKIVSDETRRRLSEAAKKAHARLAESRL